MADEYESLIPTFPLFEGYTQAGAQMLMQRGTVKHYGPGELVFREGDPAAFVLLVLTGNLQVYVERDGEELILMEMRPGSITGELGVLCGMNRSASVRATEDSAVLQWSENDFRHLLLREASLSQAIFRHALRYLLERERAEIEAALQKKKHT